MLVYWRFTIAFFSIAITFIAFYYLVKISIYDIKFADNLPSKGIKDIPPSDVILPNIFAQIPLSPPTEKTAQNTRPALSNTGNSTTLNFDISAQQCFDYAKNCRDIQCAFKDFNFTCNNNKGPVCKYKINKFFYFIFFSKIKKNLNFFMFLSGTCGASQISSASSILSNAFFPIFISLVISVYYYI